VGEEGESGGIRGLLRELTIVVVGALVASTLLRLFLVQVFLIPSRSMETTLLVGDRVAVQKVVGFERGDVVVFRDDLEWLGNPDRFSTPLWRDVLTFVGLMPDESANHLVKRVVGVEGDHVVCCDAQGRVTVNGIALLEDDYLYTNGNGRAAEPSAFPFDVVVPAGRVFVLGDHRDSSADSRCHLDEEVNGVRALGGFPSVDSVVGAVAWTIFPFDRWRSHPTPAGFAAVPDPAGPAPAEPVVEGTTPTC